MNNGYVIFKGPSRLDRKPIICVATGFAAGSNNSKTGSMIQTWILREDVPPIEAIKTGEDASICGDCRHRGTSCYVQVFQAPNNIYRSYQRGNYEELPLSGLGPLFDGRSVRLGAYGDPAAVPIGIWDTALRKAESYTGYTHQWRKLRLARLRNYCMASVDTPEEHAHAKALGWRTFRVRLPTEEVLSREVVCPASAEAGHKTTCAQCLACGGLGAKAKADIVIIAHGSQGKINNYERKRAA